MNFEHAWGDGVAVLRYVQDIYKDSITNPFVTPNTKPYDDNIQNVVRLGNIYLFKFHIVFGFIRYSKYIKISTL